MDKNFENRVHAIDVMRVMGTLLVIMAHCGIPSILFNFREFDVTMLVFVSGMSFALTYKTKNFSYGNYIWRRFQRLILPVWLFLTAYFIIFKFCFGESFSVMTLIKSYGLISGIGFVWIFRVLFATSITNPLCDKVTKHLSLIKLVFLGIILLVANDLAYHFLYPLIPNEMIQDILKILVSFTIGYGIVSMLGISWLNAQRKERIYAIFIFGILLLCLGLCFHFPNLQDFKHPPHLYYVCYGLLFCGILFEILKGQEYTDSLPNKIMFWLSKNSMSIYLWHIFALSFQDYFIPVSWTSLWYLQYFYVISFAIIFTVIQNWIMKMISRKDR